MLNFSGIDPALLPDVLKNRLKELLLSFEAMNITRIENEPLSPAQKRFKRALFSAGEALFYDNVTELIVIELWNAAQPIVEENRQRKIGKLDSNTR